MSSTVGEIYYIAIVMVKATGKTHLHSQLFRSFEEAQDEIDKNEAYIFCGAFEQKLWVELPT